MDGKSGQQGEPRESGSRGAWFTDPYGTAGERWWDGKKWTRTVRATAPEPARVSGPPFRIAGGVTARSVSERAGEDASEVVTFAIAVNALIGERVEVVPRSRRPYGRYDVVAPGGRVGELILGGSNELARMSCADGSWRVTKRVPLGWELLIEEACGQHVGWYSGRRWRRGGTIILTDGTEVDLRGSLTGRWTLQTGDGRAPLAELRRSHTAPSLSMTLSVHALPGHTRHTALLVFTACAVLMLDFTMAGVPTVGGS